MTLELGDTRWEVWHVPGHSPGHVLLYCREQATVFGGDLLFQSGYGRIDLPGCSARDMEASLARIAQLPPETRVYPGHGADVTVGSERRWLDGLLAEGLSG
jgi:glyoxylase-like metal-dependent hydrolase (beta-lactamase superfamily II)